MRQGGILRLALFSATSRWNLTYIYEKIEETPLLGGLRLANYEELVELFGLVRLHGHLWRTEWSKDNPQDISISQVQTLDILASEGAKSSSYLSQLIGVTSGGMTVISDKLVRLELVQRVSDENDRRVVKLEITDKGREALKEIQRKRIAVMEKMYHSLDPEEFQQLLRIYRKLIASHEQ